MADVTIKDGSSGNIAKVDSNKRLKVSAVTEPETNRACDSGIEQKYNFNTGDITLTNATKTSVAYIKNTGDDDLVVTALIYNLGATTSGTGDVVIDVIRQPTAGDIITNANDMLVPGTVAANQNFGSTNTPTGLFYKGATGETALSGGDVTISTRSASNTGRIVISLGAIVLPKGTAIGIDYTPPTSNSSQKCQFAFSCFVRTTLVTAE